MRMNPTMQKNWLKYADNVPADTPAMLTGFFTTPNSYPEGQVKASGRVPEMLDLWSGVDNRASGRVPEMLGLWSGVGDILPAGQNPMPCSIW